MKECYALEKIHGTSANIRFKKNKEFVEGNNLSTILFFSGGTKHGTFVKMFDEKELLKISEIQK